jgi:hypothetical protein
MSQHYLFTCLLFGTGWLTLNLGCIPNSETTKIDSVIERPRDQHESHPYGHDSDHGGKKSVQLIISSTPRQPVAGQPVQFNINVSICLWFGAL